MNQIKANLQTVLFVEADAIVRANISAYLRDCDLDVIEASDTTEAKTVLGESEKRVDIILCDAGSVGTKQGFSFTQWVKTNYDGTPVLLAGNIDDAASVAGDLCEEGPQVTKPYDPSLVVDAIKQALARIVRT